MSYDSAKLPLNCGRVSTAPRPGFHLYLLPSAVQVQVLPRSKDAGSILHAI